jgi:hypothetical protein
VVKKNDFLRAYFFPQIVMRRRIATNVRDNGLYHAAEKLILHSPGRGPHDKGENFDRSIKENH